MTLFPRSNAGGAVLTTADEARNRLLIMESHIERAMRGEHQANDHGPFESITRERARIQDARQRDNWARNHP